MSDTLVIQSHRSPLPYAWLERCLASVRNWCEKNHYDYEFLGDELFNHLADDLQQKLKDQRVIATDLARLNLLQDKLNKGYRTAVWLDADFLIFDPDNFVLPDDAYAVGREVWVQLDENDKLKVYKKVHNAFLMFKRNNSFLPFYRETAERLLHQNQGGVPPQFVGPKLLTALHNVTQLPIMETAGMFSPLVIKDIAQNGGEALHYFIRSSPQTISGANLCISSRVKNEISCAEMERAIDTLLNTPTVCSTHANF